MYFSYVKRLAFILIVLVFLSILVGQGVSQTPNDLTALSYQAFSQLANVYQAGGQAPDLLAKMNQALGIIQDARIKRAQGDIADANRLEDQASSTIRSVLNSASAVQDQAVRDSNMRSLVVIASVPIVIVLSTFIFYASLRVWRRYENMKLYEMRIVEKKTEA